jgi:lysozyme family protein
LSQFDLAFEGTLKWEDPSGRGVVTSDTGGLTRWGISQKAYPQVDIANLSLEDAKALYKRDYWKPIYESIASQNIASKLFDLCVNMGKKQGVKILQLACASCGEPTTCDGVFGVNTLAAVNRCDSQNLLTEMRHEACDYYTRLATQDPNKYGSYLRGWLRRARS